MSTSVLITFNSTKQADTFFEWLEGQGESDLVPWFEEHGECVPKFSYDKKNLHIEEID